MSRKVERTLFPQDSSSSDSDRLVIVGEEEEATEVQEASKDSDVEEREVQDPEEGTSSRGSVRRCPSFTEAESTGLVSKVLEHHDRLFGQSATFQERMDIWTTIASEVSKVSSHCRTVEQCKIKFRVCRNLTKKKMEKTGRARKGRGRPSKTAAWETMLREQMEFLPTPEKTPHKRRVPEDFEDTRPASDTGKRKKKATGSHDEEAAYEEMPALEGEEEETVQDVVSLEVDVVVTPLEHQEQELRRTTEEPEVQRTAEQGTQTGTRTATATTQTDSTLESRIDRLTHLVELQARHQEQTSNSMLSVISLLRTHGELISSAISSQQAIIQNLNMMWTTQRQATVSSEASAAVLHLILEELRRIQSRAPEDPQP